MASEIDEILRLASENTRARNRRAPFLKGPIPLPWIHCAASLPGKSLAIGLMLWWRFGLAGENPVKATMAHCLSFGVRTRAGRRAAISALKRAGLVAVELSSTKAPRVTILDAGKPVLPRTTKASRGQSKSGPPKEATTQLHQAPHTPP